MSKDFAQLIGTWPRDAGRTSIGTFAEDIRVPYQHAATMKQRNSIATEFWPNVLKAAVARGKELSHEQLLKMREARRRKSKAGQGRPRSRQSQRDATQGRAA